MINVVLSEFAKSKLRHYKSEYYTKDETSEFIRELSKK